MLIILGQTRVLIREKTMTGCKGPIGDSIPKLRPECTATVSVSVSHDQLDSTGRPTIMRWLR